MSYSVVGRTKRRDYGVFVRETKGLEISEKPKDEFTVIRAGTKNKLNPFTGGWNG